MQDTVDADRINMEYLSLVADWSSPDRPGIFKSSVLGALMSPITNLAVELLFP